MPDHPAPRWTILFGLLALGCQAPLPPTPATPGATQVRLRVVALTRSTAPLGEDGHGREVQSTAPLALEAVGHDWPVRALDPALHVGPLFFATHENDGHGTLRFVVADRALLPLGAPVFVQYGDDERSRVALGTLDRLP